MPLIPTPTTHPPPDPTIPGPPPTGAPGSWTGWHSVSEMLNTGDIPVPVASGAYVFRINPAVGLVPRGCPTRLVDIGGMGKTGSLYGGGVSPA